MVSMTGFLDGINDSLVEANPIEEMEEDTEVNLGFDKTSLYKNMVAAEADWPNMQCAEFGRRRRSRASIL